MYPRGLVSRWVAEVVRHAYKFDGWFFADSAGCPLGRFSHWWRSVWVSVFGERGVHTSSALASTVLLGCQKHGNCTLGQLMSPRSESAFFASFLCRFGQRNDVPPRTVANSDKEMSQRKQTAKAESSNPALTPTANAGTWHLNPTPPPTSNPEPRPKTKRQRSILPRYHVQRQRLDPVSLPRAAKRLEPGHA